MKLELLPTSRPAVAPGVMLRAEDFGAVVAGGRLPIISLNETAVEVWRLCDGSRTVSAIETALLDRFAETGIKERLREFLEFCLKNGYMTQ